MNEQYSDDLSKIELFPNGKQFRLTYDSSVDKLRIIARSYQDLDQIRKDFSVENGSAFFVKQYGYNAALRLYAINKFGYMSLGLIFEFLMYIREQYGTLNVIAMSPQCKSYIEEFGTPLKKYLNSLDSKCLEASNISDDVGRNVELKNSGKNEYKFRDYQKSSIEMLLNKGFGRGLIEVPTGGGKSFILANFIWTLLKNVNRQFKTMILVPNKQLVEQFYKDLIDYGYDNHEVTRFTAGLKGKNSFNPEAKIVVANRQYVFLNKDKLPKFDVLICDECHQCCSESTSEYIEQLDCKIKIGCSGTIPRDKYKRWLLIGLFGRIVYMEDIIKLQDLGFISKLKITSIKIIDKSVEADRNILFHTNSIRKYHQDEFGYSDIAFNEAHDAEKEYYSKHYRELYKPVLDYVDKLDENTLLLFDRIEVGTNLYTYAKELMKDKNVHYIDGSIPVSKREIIRQQLEESGNNVLFAENATFSTGINVKRLNHICFVCGTKSFSQVLQSIGRTLRLHSSKDEAHVIDVSMNFKYSQRHYAERLKIYKDMYHLKPSEVLKFEI